MCEMRAARAKCSNEITDDRDLWPGHATCCEVICAHVTRELMRALTPATQPGDDRARCGATQNDDADGVM
jgi:hypothetical protein